MSEKQVRAEITFSKGYANVDDVVKLGGGYLLNESRNVRVDETGTLSRRDGATQKKTLNDGAGSPGAGYDTKFHGFLEDTERGVRLPVVSNGTSVYVILPTGVWLTGPWNFPSIGTVANGTMENNVLTLVNGVDKPWQLRITSVGSPTASGDFEWRVKGLEPPITAAGQFEAAAQQPSGNPGLKDTPVGEGSEILTTFDLMPAAGQRGQILGVPSTTGGGGGHKVYRYDIDSDGWSVDQVAGVNVETLENETSQPGRQGHHLWRKWSDDTFIYVHSTAFDAGGNGGAPYNKARFYDPSNKAFGPQHQLIGATPTISPNENFFPLCGDIQSVLGKTYGWVLGGPGSGWPPMAKIVEMIRVGAPTFQIQTIRFLYGPIAVQPYPAVVPPYAETIQWKIVPDNVGIFLYVFINQATSSDFIRIDIASKAVTTLGAYPRNIYHRDTAIFSNDVITIFRGDSTEIFQFKTLQAGAGSWTLAKPGATTRTTAGTSGVPRTNLWYGWHGTNNWASETIP